VNSIKVIKDGSENHGRLLINVGNSAFTSSDIVVDVKDIHSMVALGNDDFGETGNDGNVLNVSRYFCKSSDSWVEEARPLTLPGDAFRDKPFLDWILSEKSEESELVRDFQDLMIQQHERATKDGKIGGFDILAARDQVTLLGDSDAVIDSEIKSNSSSVDTKL
jgi:hypothetical protein